MAEVWVRLVVVVLGLLALGGVASVAGPVGLVVAVVVAAGVGWHEGGVFYEEWSSRRRTRVTDAR